MEMHTQNPYQSANTPGAAQSNGWGMAGLILGILQIFTLGLLAPIGLIVSLLGLRKEPRGAAIAGVVLNGALGIPLLVIAGVMFTVAMVGMSLDSQFQDVHTELNGGMQTSPEPSTEPGYEASPSVTPVETEPSVGGSDGDVE